jgi:hypothetical protein
MPEQHLYSAARCAPDQAHSYPHTYSYNAGCTTLILHYQASARTRTHIPTTRTTACNRHTTYARGVGTPSHDTLVLPKHCDQRLAPSEEALVEHKEPYYWDNTGPDSRVPRGIRAISYKACKQQTELPSRCTQYRSESIAG